jgi:hypothetical protein
VPSLLDDNRFAAWVKFFGGMSVKLVRSARAGCVVAGCFDVGSESDSDGL